MQWSGPAEFSVAFDVEMSDDLRAWRPGGSGQLMALASASGVLTQPRVMLPAQPGRFVRLVWSDQRSAPVLTGAQVIVEKHRSVGVDAPTELRLAASPEAAGKTPLDEASKRALHFDLSGLIPMVQLDLQLAPGTHVDPVRIQGRQRADAPWQDLASSVFYRLERGGNVSTSPPLSVQTTVRYLRLIPDERAAALDATQTRLIVQAPLATLVFATQGQSPYRLLSGSATAPAGALPATTLVPALDEERPRFGQATVGLCLSIVGRLDRKAAAPGRYEFEVQAALDAYCYANGVRRMAYPSIAASAPNSVFLHWDRNDRQIRDGDVVLNDSGAEYGFYATDITRTYPANGRFSAEQRAIYDVVLAAQKAALAQIRPGVPFDRVGAAAARVQTEGLVKLGLLSGNVEKIVKESGHRVFTKHAISHWVGLDVHDAGSYNVGVTSRPLVPGMIFTVEPGIYVGADSGADRKWWDIGIRVEDVVLVTDTGYECLSCFVPREAAEVERTVQSGRPSGNEKP